MAPATINIPAWVSSAGWLGWAFFLLAIAGYFLNRKKGRIEESAMLLGKWRELFDAHTARIEEYERKIEGYEKRIEANTREIADLRDRLGAAETRILELERTVIDKDRTIAGLERQLAQVTQSTAAELGANMTSPEVGRAISRTMAERGKKNEEGDK